MSIHGFWMFASFILMVLVILLEIDVFKPPIYLDIYLLCVWAFCQTKVLTHSVKDSKFIEAFILRCLLKAYTNKISKILTLKLTTDLSFIDVSV